MTPVIIWQLIISLLIFIISIPIMYLLSFLFRYKWIKKFFKIWIIFIFIIFISKIVLISNPFQNSEIIYLVLLIFYTVLFYWLHYKEKNIAWNKFKRSHKIVFFSVFIFSLLIFGRVEPLFTGNSLLNDNEVYLNENKVIAKWNEYWEKFFAMYDNDNNGVYETVKYDINWDNIADIINIDFDENWEIDDIEILTYNKQGYILIFLLFIFISLSFFYNKYINSKKWWNNEWGNWWNDKNKDKQKKIKEPKKLVLDALKWKIKIRISAWLFLLLIINNIYNISIVNAYPMDQSTIEREFKACLEDPFNSVKCSWMNQESLKYIRLLYSYPEMRKDYENLGKLAQWCQKWCSQATMQKLSTDWINLWNKWKDKPVIFPNNNSVTSGSNSSQNNTNNNTSKGDPNNTYDDDEVPKTKWFDSENNKTDYKWINNSLTALSKSVWWFKTIFDNVNKRIIPKNINWTNIDDVTKRLKNILKWVNPSSNYNWSDYKELLKHIYSSGNTGNVDDILDDIKWDYWNIVWSKNINKKLWKIVKWLDKLWKWLDIISNWVHFHEKLNWDPARVITATTVSTWAKWVLENNPVSAVISWASTITYYAWFEWTASDIDRINIWNVTKDLITDAYTTEDWNFMRIVEYEMLVALKNWENPNLSTTQKVWKHLWTTVYILYTWSAALTKTLLENKYTNKLSRTFNDGAKVISKTISKIF